MADTFTAVLSLTKPEVGASLDTWGTKLNDNFDDVDGLFQAGPALKVANGGTAATTASGARTNLGLGTMATQDASAVAITGGTASLSSVTLSGTTPVVVWYQSDGGTDEKYVYSYADGTTWDVRFYNDAQNSYTSPILVSRTGTTVDSIALTATAVTINGNAAWHAGNDGAGSGLDADTVDGLAPTSGSFTIYLRASNNGADLASGTANWKRFNGVVSLEIPQLLTSNATTSLYLDGIPADIQKTGTTHQLVSHGMDNGNNVVVSIGVSTGVDYWLLNPANATAFAATSVKGIYPTTLTYIL
ncbi:hypothetical protein LDC_1286 [sediment metagenome]|uniref:Uncharacterized protein n=1 Tax=sediment metagenome TaxID=749907 RepID=D9PID0_9ZZZZ